MATPSSLYLWKLEDLQGGMMKNASDWHHKTAASIDGEAQFGFQLEHLSSDSARLDKRNVQVCGLIETAWADWKTSGRIIHIYTQLKWNELHQVAHHQQDVTVGKANHRSVISLLHIHYFNIQHYHPFNNPESVDITETPKILIKQLVFIIPTARLRAKQALVHP